MNNKLKRRMRRTERCREYHKSRSYHKKRRACARFWILFTLLFMAGVICLAAVNA